MHCKMLLLVLNVRFYVQQDVEMDLESVSTHGYGKIGRPNPPLALILVFGTLASFGPEFLLRNAFVKRVG